MSTEGGGNPTVDNGFATAGARAQNDLDVDDDWRRQAYAYALGVIDELRDALDAAKARAETAERVEKAEAVIARVRALCDGPDGSFAQWKELVRAALDGDE